ncbi:hypothetical protein [Rhizobium sp. No.120]
MPLKLVSGMMKSSGNEALLVMDAGHMNKIVLVTKQALLDMALPPRCDESRLQEYIDVLSDIASTKYDRGEIKPDGRVLITSSDVAKWKELQ